MKTLKYILTSIMILSFSSLATAQDTEEITLTTYYPAPYGEYDEITTDTMAANKIAVGDASMPTSDGVISLQITDDSASQPAGVKGAIYFSGKDNELKFHDGTSWKSTSRQRQVPDYDSGWFGVDFSQTHIKAHTLGGPPTRVIILQSTQTTGTPTHWSDKPGNQIATNTAEGPFWWQDATNIYVNTGQSGAIFASGYLYLGSPNSGSVSGTHSTYRSKEGQYRVLAWKDF
jgi:hypothetical protein